MKKIFEILIDFVVVIAVKSFLSLLATKLGFLTSDLIWQLSALAGILFAEFLTISRKEK